MDSPTTPETLIVAEQPTLGRFEVAGKSIHACASMTRDFLKFW